MSTPVEEGLFGAIKARKQILEVQSQGKKNFKSLMIMRHAGLLILPNEFLALPIRINRYFLGEDVLGVGACDHAFAEIGTGN